MTVETGGLLINGTYTTKRDGGVVYTYQAKSHRDGTQWHWEAKVWHAGGFLAGHPSGMILKASWSFDEKHALEAMVEQAIEARAGVS